MRVAIGNSSAPNAGGTWFVSTTPVNLPNDGNWHTLTFDVNAGMMTNAGGADSFATVAANVIRLRILHNPGVSANGASAVANIGLDNITPRTPTAVSLAGINAANDNSSVILLVIGAALLLLTLASFVVTRRAQPQF